MSPDPHVLMTFGLLALAVLRVWIPLPDTPAFRDGPFRLVLVACGVGLVYGVLDWRAPVAIVCYALIAERARDRKPGWLRTILLFVTGIGAFLFALHRVPGFVNPVLADGIRFSADAPPFSLHANFDTAVAGIVLVT